MNTIIALLAWIVMNTPFHAEAAALDKAELFCMATAIYHEARGEPVEGQVAVAYVILNRMDAPQYPTTACGVVYQEAQFTDIELAKPNFHSPAWKIAANAAIMASLGIAKDPTNGALFYYAPKHANPYWAKRKMVVAEIGNHRFLN